MNFIINENSIALNFKINTFMKKVLILSLFSLVFFSCKKESSNNLQSTVIGNSVKIGNLEIAENDFPYRMDWATAKKSCSDLGLGWRLPDALDRDIINKNLSKIPGLKLNDNGYWSNEEALAFQPSNNYSGKENKSSALNVRAVR